MSFLERAIQLAVKAHAGQVDKNGEIYILHPLRVMMRMDSDIEKAAAVLHDVIEDTDVTLDMLVEEGMPDDVITAVISLTRVENEIYKDFIHRVKKNHIAKKVKIADLKDNLDFARIIKLKKEDLTIIERYRKAWEILME